MVPYDRLAFKLHIARLPYVNSLSIPVFYDTAQTYPHEGVVLAFPDCPLEPYGVRRTPFQMLMWAVFPEAGSAHET